MKSYGVTVYITYCNRVTPAQYALNCLGENLNCFPKDILPARFQFL